MASSATAARPSVRPPEKAGRWSIQEPRDGVLLLTHDSAGAIEPEDSIARLIAALELLPGSSAIGARRVDREGNIFSIGEFVTHPKGFHHHGRGVDATAFRFPEPVDAICGGVVAITKDDFERCGGVGRLREPLGMLELCLALRAGGGSCLVVPDVQVQDDDSPLDDSVITESDDRAFRDRWGFDWRCVDLDELTARHAGTGLLWNVRFFGQPMPFEKYDTRPLMHWKSYDEVDVYRQRADQLVELVHRAAEQHGGSARIIDLGCGDGLFSHLFARCGAEVIGVDPEANAITQAETAVRRVAEQGGYAGPAPVFRVGLGQTLPFEDNAAHVIAMLDVIEHLPNPVAVLREVERVLAPGGQVVISTPAWQYGGWSDPVYHVTEYRMDELVRQVEHATTCTVTQTGRIGGVYRDLVVVAGKTAP